MLNVNELTYAVKMGSCSFLEMGHSTKSLFVEDSRQK